MHMFETEEMMKEEKEVRRSFLKRMLGGSAVVATSIAAIRPAKAQSQVQVPTGSDEVLYKESKAFKKYYDTL